MRYLKFIVNVNSILIFSFVFSCAYFNTLYNAQQYFDEAETHRLEKEGKTIPLSAIDKYGKTIQKCQKSLKEYPNSRWKVDAYLLMSKARYYRKDYDVALENLDTVIIQGNTEQIDEGKYWIALCKWKKGTSSSAVNELEGLLETTSYDFIKARCYLSLADISDENSKTEEALQYLEYGAKLTKNRAQRGLLYGQLADLAFKRNNYSIAKNAYKQVITNSLSKEKIEKAHLQILRIYRLENEYKSASKKIKSMLVDDKFKNISGYLELELVQIYMSQKEFDESINRLETIVNNYQRTEVSSEAYFLLGQIYTTQRWDLQKSKEYFEKVGKEYAKSIYKPLANSRVKTIDKYLGIYEKYQYSQREDKNKVDSLAQNKNAVNDSLTSIVKENKKTIPEITYELADIEWFGFKRKDESIKYFMYIINNFTNSPFHPKALFTLSYIYRTVDDSTEASKIENILIDKYPNSDFVSFIKSNSASNYTDDEALFLKIQDEWNSDWNNSVKLFDDLISTTIRNDLSVSAAYFLGYNFDQVSQVDSAIKYYSWINDNYPESEHALMAKTRLNTLNNALSIVTSDTLKQKEER